MQYAERLPQLPSPKAIAAPLAALALGAAVATGAYALIDDNNQVVKEPSKVIVLDTPQPAGPGTAAKDEAATAAAISPRISSTPSDGVNAKDEAGTAAAISPTHRPAPTGSDGVNAKDEAGTAASISSATGALELRGSKASATGSSGSPAVSQSSTGSRGDEQQQSVSEETIERLRRFSGH